MRRKYTRNLTNSLYPLSFSHFFLRTTSFRREVALVVRKSRLMSATSRARSCPRVDGTILSRSETERPCLALQIAICKFNKRAPSCVVAHRANLRRARLPGHRIGALSRGSVDAQHEQDLLSDVFQTDFHDHRDIRQSMPGILQFLCDMKGKKLFTLISAIIVTR